MARPSGREIRREVMEEARRAIQSRGVTGFSYGDLAARIGIQAPSIHHHFARKGDLVTATTRAYRQEYRARVEALDDPSPLGRLHAYCRLFLAPAGDGLLCLCGAVAADWDATDDATRAEVETFVGQEEAWLTTQIEEAVAAGELAHHVEPASLALTLLAALEGALVLARTSTAGERVLDAPIAVLDLVTASPQPATPSG